MVTKQIWKHFTLDISVRQPHVQYSVICQLTKALRQCVQLSRVLLWLTCISPVLMLDQVSADNQANCKSRIHQWDNELLRNTSQLFYFIPVTCNGTNIDFKLTVEVLIYDQANHVDVTVMWCRDDHRPKSGLDKVKHLTSLMVITKSWWLYGCWKSCC